jgi:hypothetical protein
MKLKVVIHPAEEGGYWVEVPAISGCTTQGETFEELLKNICMKPSRAVIATVRMPKSIGSSDLLTPASN